MKTSDLVDTKDLLKFLEHKVAWKLLFHLQLCSQWPEPPKRIFCRKAAETKIRTKEETMQYKIKQLLWNK